MQGRRGAARRGVGFSLFVLISMSTLLGFAGQVVVPIKAIAAETPDISEEKAKDIQMLMYFKDCLKTRLAEKGTGSDGAFRGYYEIFQNFSDGQDNKRGKQVIVVGPGIAGKGSDGVWACESIAKEAIAIYKPELKDDSYQSYLMRAIWGKSYADNGSKPVKVSATKVKRNRDELVASIEKAISKRKAEGSLRYATLKRFGPLLDQCYEKWSSTPPGGGGKNEDERLSYPKRKVYAESRGFGWRDINIVTIQQSGRDIRRNKWGLLGNIPLDFKTTFGNIQNDSKFDDKISDWFPIGDDVGKSIIGEDLYKQHDDQSFLDCNWIKQHGDYLFDQSIANKYYYAVKDGRPWIYKITTDGKGQAVTSEVEPIESTTLDTGDGSKTYQCVVAPPLSWIACPIITLTVKSLDVLEGAIIQAVQVPPLTTDGPFEGLHATWAGFRDVANAFLVLIFLITIFAQVLPFDIDPYMVKKVLPRLIAAAICIQFSYFIVQIMFDISRVLAQGVATLIESFPASDIGGGLFGQSAGNSTATSALGFVGALAAGTAAGAAAFTAGTALIVPIVLLLFAGLISVVTLFVTLQVRMIVIIILTIIAPLAFLAWILPNTENYFKKWFTSLIKLLLMYPIIVFMVQGVNLISNISYEALAAMAGSNDGVAGGVSDISKLMVSVIPIIVYFMIPMTFKWAGGIFASIAGAVQGQGGRISKRVRSGSMMKNSLEGLRQKTGERLANTDKFGVKDLKNPRRYGAGMQRLGARVATGNAFSFGKVGARKLAQTANAARHTQLEAQMATVKDLNAGNDVIGEMISARLDGKDEYTYTDRAGHKKTIKLSDDMVPGGMRYLNENGGQIELAKIGNGTMEYKDGLGLKAGKADAAFKNNQFENLGDGGKFKMGEIFKEATDGNVAPLMKAAPHLVHGKKAAMYKEAGGDVFAGIKGESMDVATEAIKGDIDAEANFADAIVDIMNSSTKSGGIDKATATKMKALIEDKTSTVGDQMIDFKDNKGPVKLRDAVDRVFTAGGKIAYNDRANRNVPKKPPTP